jgi:hypothetical protein
MADQGGYDIRLEAAAAKEWNTVTGWRSDDTIQVRQPKCETEQSLAERSATPYPVRRAMRDYRISFISKDPRRSATVHGARGGDKHQVAGSMIDPDSRSARLAGLPKMALFYAG